MHQTLLYIPERIGGFPVFGWGVLLVLWIIITGITLLSDYRKAKSWKSLGSFIPIALLGAAAIIWLLPRIVKPGGLPIQSYGAMMLLGILSGVALAIYRARKFNYSSDIIISLAIWMCLPGIIGARLFFCIEYWNEMQGDTLAQTIANMLSFTEGGLVVYGSVFGALAGAVVFFLITPNPNANQAGESKHLPVLRMLDIIAPSMVLGLALGRIGCLLNGCCFGGVCDAEKVPWAITFPAGSPPFMQQLEENKINLEQQPVQGMILKKTPLFSDQRFSMPNGEAVKSGLFVQSVTPSSPADKAGIKPNDMIIGINGASVYNQNYDVNIALVYYQLTADARHKGTVELDLFSRPSVSWKYSSAGEIRSLPVHPTQIYSSLTAFLLLIIVLVFDRFPHWEGAVFALLFTLYPINRWILEYIRVDEDSFMGTGMSISQNVSMLILPAVIALWIYLWRRDR